MMKLNASTDSYEQIEDIDILNMEVPIEKTENIDKAMALAEGLSTATTIAQIRAVAKAILDETEGTE